jgi:hypothetical protein
MTEHFTRNTVSAAFHCAKCGKPTQHRIDDCRKGPCLECIARLNKAIAERVEGKKPVASTQEDLFR